MKKQFILVGGLMAGLALMASQTMYIFKGGAVSYDKLVSEIDSLKLASEKAIFHIDADGSTKTLDIANIDSMTFADINTTATGDITIIYTSGSVEVINPYYASGVAISVNGTTTTSADQTLTGSTVSATSTAALSGLVYHVQGTATDGSLAMSTDKAFNLSLENLTLACSTAAPISISTSKEATISLVGASSLTDASTNASKAALYSKSELLFNGTGSLSVTGVAKHAIFTSDLCELDGGSITIASAASDGIHCDDFIANGGTLTVNNVLGDCVDAEKDLTVATGTLTLSSSADDCKGLKAAGSVYINGGTLQMDLSGAGAKGIKTDTTNIEIAGGSTTINLTGTGYATADTSFSAGIKTDSSVIITNGTLNISVAGQGGKGIKADGRILVAGGTKTITTSGSPVTLGGENTVCTAVKANYINQSAGTTTITLDGNAKGAKGYNSDGDLYVTGGTLNITANNLFSTYTNASNQADTTGVACIKAEGNINLLDGNITLKSTANGKGVSGSGTSSIVNIGTLGAGESGLVLNISGTPNTSYTYTSTGGNGTRTHYTGNPKGITSNDSIAINGGTIVVNVPANGVHAYRTGIHGGKITITAAYGSNYYKGFRGDTCVTIAGGHLIIKSAYEAVEGFRITATGGISEIVSSDDGWNATSAHLSATSGTVSYAGPGGSTGGGGTAPGGGSTGGTSSSSGYLVISGGAHYVYAGGDGIDSNGDETISGGLVVCNQNGSGGNGIFDKGDNSSNVLSITGNAVVLGFGGSDMNETPSTTLNTTGYSSISVSDGNMLYVTSNGSVIAAVKVRSTSSASAAILVNPTYSSVSFSTSGSATLDRFNGTTGENLFYVAPALYSGE